MDASTIAAIAALAVAFVAFLVTFAQATQQYVVLGQLIRICDSVVYGTMPGQGHHVWEYSQFRFRIVYSIPRISLLRDVWDMSSPVEAHSEQGHQLPSLGLSKSKASRSSIAGEASWVSFTRTIQYASGMSLRYEMVEGDADRCPTDLPVVPMQLSMRDVIALAVRAGMECTDVSFELQTLSMQSSPGTITSSRHPVLGALIHFAPKQPFETHGIQAKHGTLDPNWLARMSDTMVVAGIRYDQRDRRHYEEDEGSWIRSSSDKSMVPSVHLEIRHQPNPTNETRRRRQTRKTPSDKPPQEYTTGLRALVVIEKSIDSNVSSLNDLRRPQDGEWLFSMEPSDCHGSVTRDRNDSNLADPQPPQEAWSSRKLSVLRKKLQALASSGKTERSKNVLPIAKPKEENIRPPMAKAASSQHDPPPRTPTLKKRSTRRFPVMGKNAKRLLDKQDLRGYISEERQLESSQHNIDVDSYEATSQLLLTSEEHKDTIESPNKTRFPVDHRKRNDDDSRTDYVVDKWQRIFKERQKERSRRRSRADRTDSFDLNQSRQPPGDGVSESDHSSSVDGATRNQFYGENRPRRTSASPDEHSLFGGGRRRNPSLAGERIPLVQSNHPVIYGNAPVLSGPPKSIDSPSIQAVAPSPRAGQKRKITIASPPRLPSTPSDRSCSPKLESPTNPPATPVPPRRILREPSATFPEDSNPIREGVAPARLAQDGRHHIPPDARWTKIDRKLVNPEALAAGNERYEERTDYVIVLRVLTKKEVEAYALRTQQIRRRLLFRFAPRVSIDLVTH